MTSTSPFWHIDAPRLPGSVSATLGLTREDWERSGAQFQEIDDGDGETIAAATGTIHLDGQPQRFGVMIYDNDHVSYLLVGGDYDTRATRTAAIIDGLVLGGIITDPATTLEIVGLEQPASTDDKLTYGFEVFSATLADVQAQLDAVRQATAPGLIVAPLHPSSLWSHGELRNLLGETEQHGRRLPIAVTAPADMLDSIKEDAETIDSELISYDLHSGRALVATTIGHTPWHLSLLISGLSSPEDLHGFTIPIALPHHTSTQQNAPRLPALDVTELDPHRRRPGLYRRISFRIISHGPRLF